ncbi:MAG: tetratricopeptide repeat protein [Umezawaea sp.]
MGLSAVTLGGAGLLFNLYLYAAGAAVLIAGGAFSALAERQTRPSRRMSSAAAAVPRPPIETNGQIWTIPRPVHTFAGRVTDLNRLKRQFSRSPGSLTVVALHGMPGLGKTQLAMAYAERHRESFEIGWWITATNRLWAVAGLAGLAEHLGISADDQEQAAHAAVAELARRRSWLLVFDDATEQADLDGLVPNGCGQVLVTSRNPEWSTVATTTEIPSLSEGDAVKLLIAQSGDDDKDAASAVAIQLRGLPLAIAQAGSYCRFRAVKLAEYHQQLMSNWSRLLNEGGTGPYPLPITATVTLTLEQLRRKSTTAVQLLRLLAFLGPTAIPKDLLTCRPEVLPRQLACAARDQLALDRAIQVLAGTSLVSLDRPGHVRVHVLVQDILRADIHHRRDSRFRRAQGFARMWSDDSGNWPVTRWIDAAGALLDDALPDDPGDLNLWSRCAELHPHASAYLTHAHRHGGDLVLRRNLYGKVAAYLRDRGEFVAARRYLESALEIKPDPRSDTGPNDLDMLYDLSYSMYRQGHYREARHSLEQLIESRGPVRSVDNPNSLKAEMQLGFVLTEMGYLDKALPLSQNAYDSYLLAFGPHHLVTLRAQLMLGFTLAELGRTGEALQLQEDSYRGYLTAVGADHLGTLMALHNVSRLRVEVGQYEVAKNDLREVLSTLTRTYDDLHPFCLYARHNLARALWFEGADLGRAGQQFEEVLEARVRTIGGDHPKTLTTRHYLARVLAAVGRGDEAEEHLRRTADARQLVLGPDSPHTLLAMDDLSRLSSGGRPSVHGMDAARRFRPDLASGPCTDHP